MGKQHPAEPGPEANLRPSSSHMPARPPGHREASTPRGSVPDLDVALPGAGGEHGGQHGVEGGAHAGLRVPVQRAGAAGGAEAVHQDPAVGAARQQQVAVRGALAAHGVAFHLRRVSDQLSDRAAQRTRPRGPSHRGAAGPRPGAERLP